MTAPDLTRELVGFALTMSWQDLPAPTRAAARRTVGNAVALAVGSSNAPAVQHAMNLFKGLGSPAQVTVLGRAERLSLTAAPVVNGIAVHVEDYDDTHLPTVVHPGAPIVPAALAMAEHRGASAEEFLTTVAVGIEVALRVANSICPEHFDRGWHLTGTAGHLGAAVAAGRLAGLNAGQLTVALGLAATQAAGLTEALGTMTKSFHPGKAAGDGVDAALLAERGFTGPPHPIEGRRGLAALASSRFEPQQALDGLGETWELERNAFKPYACGIVSHPIIDAGISLAAQVDAEDVRAVRVRVHPVVLDVMGVEEPHDGLSSKFSSYHAFAVGFLDGAGGLEQFSNARAIAEDVVRMRRLVTIDTDPSIAKGAAEVRLETSGGGHEELVIEHAIGSEERPMTDAQLRRKARTLVEPVLGERTSELIEHAFAVDQVGLEALLAVAYVEEVNR